MSVTETLLSFVNSWECDENDHLNVQFYAAKMEEAHRQFLAISGLGESLQGKRRIRQIRYHKESRVGILLRVNSWLTFEDPQYLLIIHEMREVGSDQLIATATDGYPVDSLDAHFMIKNLDEYESNLNPENMPRSSRTFDLDQNLNSEYLLEHGSFIVHRNSILPRNCGTDSMADDRFIVSCCSDGAAHMWEKTMLTKNWLETKGYGRIALEMKLSFQKGLPVGRLVKVVSGITGFGRKTFSFRHHFFDSSNDRLEVMVDIVAAILDLNTRQSVPVPDFAKTKMEELQI